MLRDNSCPWWLKFLTTKGTKIHEENSHRAIRRRAVSVQSEVSDADPHVVQPRFGETSRNGDSERGVDDADWKQVPVTAK
jgi:hypothetical protein